MHKIQLACALLGTTLPVIAQCTGAPPASAIKTREDWAASFYYGNLTNNDLVMFFDAVVTAPLTVTSMATVTYDQGAGNPVVPNQVGANTNVNIWQVPTTWTGNTAADPGAGGTPWTLLGTGTLTVVAWPGTSPIAVGTPFVLPVGTYGIAVEVEPSTSGPAPGAMHTLGVNPDPFPVATDPYMTISNQAIQQTGWTGGVNTATGLNLEIGYTPDPASAYFRQFGDGCYFRPFAFYEDFPASATAPDLANTGLSMLPIGVNYLVTATPSTIVPPVSASLTTGAFGASSSASWDDALSTPITLPFTFNYAGGSTTTITIGSNGSIFLDAETNGSFDVCGAMYGSIPVLRDNKPRIACWWTDLDASVGGGIHYDVDPSNNFVRITWLNVGEWPSGALNTMQLTLHASGQVDMSFGALANPTVANGNNAIVGFTNGNGARLPAPQDLSATMPFQSGDGAIPPLHSMSARPISGTTPNILTQNIAAGTLFSFQLLGFASIPTPGLPLAGFGLPGCFLHVNPLSNVFLPVVSGTVSYPVPIPGGATFLGVQLQSQNLPLTAGLNPGGAVSSNGMCFRIGAF
jgi:hypothetical protein